MIAESPAYDALLQILGAFGQNASLVCCLEPKLSGLLSDFWGGCERPMLALP